MCLISWGVLLACRARRVKLWYMCDGNMTPTPVRFPAELMARVDAVSKALALSHSGVLRLAVNQWFEAGGDKSGLFSPAKSSAGKATPKGRNKKAAF